LAKRYMERQIGKETCTPLFLVLRVPDVQFVLPDTKFLLALGTLLEPVAAAFDVDRCKKKNLPSSSPSGDERLRVTLEPQVLKGRGTGDISPLSPPFLQ
jgi:hypothetical protein